MQRFGQGEADIAQALNGDPQPFQVVATKTRLGSGANAREYAHGCVRRRITFAGRAGCVIGVLGDAVHVGAGGAAVDGGDVTTIEGFDETPEGFEQRGPTLQMRRTDDHRLAATVIDTGQRRLVAHALSQTNGIANGALFIGIGQVATTAERRPEAGIVNGDNGSEAAGRILGQVQSFELGGLHHAEHGCAPGRMSRLSIGEAHWTTILPTAKNSTSLWRMR